MDILNVSIAPCTLDYHIANATHTNWNVLVPFDFMAYRATRHRIQPLLHPAWERHAAAYRGWLKSKYFADSPGPQPATENP